MQNGDEVKGGNTMYRFPVIIEKGDTSYGAYCPDLPGCVAVGRTCEEVEQNMREPIPLPHNDAEYMDISLPT